ncbi:ABC transporter ATP-binding protein [Myceligenerans xiligouense]|uniref:Amino acid/amide ABC transporter ATP-binding protein 2 (HAAT family) n=1 Tax=Myceligenerans xiligouense TaxID=253184 RepID=A0A3N4YT69_9MICO|nr:ABC transporter ATP-binding protein [Myceligenerans xiligouense]RPF22574.1 amino acid/amide ABC transporter ATP-binding protein 2 (HAAT family) [Myceligenerans xiligouense]
MSTNVLEVRGLAARIAGQEVVHDVGLEVPATGVTAVLGRNGVGKTSTLRAILGLIERTGEVLLDGHRVDGERTERIVQRGVGYVPEDRDVFAGLTVAENLRLAERTGPHGTTPERRHLVEDLFPDLVPRAQQRAGTLSGGQQQMVSLARTLLNDNRLLLVDEPTKGLAPRIVDDVAAALAAAARTVPILLVEQNLEVIERLAERVVVIDAGRVVHTGPARELLDDPDMIQRLLGVHADGVGTSGTGTSGTDAATTAVGHEKEGAR